MKHAYTLPLGLLSFLFVSAQNDPVHHWPLDESTGLIASDITGGENGMLQNGCTWQPGGGHFGGALLFDGADDRVDLGPCDITTGTGDALAISLWLKPGLMTGSEQTLITKTTGPNTSDFVWSVSQVNSTAIRFRVKAGGSVSELTTTGSSLFSGQWYHIAAIYDGAEMRLLINGAPMVSMPKSGTLPFAPQAPATMGGRTDGTAQLLGRLDDVRIYDHALSDAQVVDLVIGDVATTMEQGTITIAEDGRMVLPPGEWERMRLVDLAGRTVFESGLRDGASSLPLPMRTAGAFLVCLQGRQRWVVMPLVMP